MIYTTNTGMHYTRALDDEDSEDSETSSDEETNLFIFSVDSVDHRNVIDIVMVDHGYEMVELTGNTGFYVDNGCYDLFERLVSISCTALGITQRPLVGRASL